MDHEKIAAALVAARIAYERDKDDGRVWRLVEPGRPGRRRQITVDDFGGRCLVRHGTGTAGLYRDVAPADVPAAVVAMARELLADSGEREG